MRSWYMPKASADALAALVDDVHFATRLPKRPLSDNGTMVVVKKPRGTPLTPMAVPMSQSACLFECRSERGPGAGRRALQVRGICRSSGS
jgi:hypothetical protein